MVTLNMLYRLAVYAPDGPFKGYLDGLSSWSASLPVNDLGSLKIKCVAGSSASGLLAGPCEVAIQVWDGSKWIEPVNGRYMRVEASTDKASGDASMIDYTLVSYGKLLDSVLVVPAKFGKPEHYDKDGKRAFLSATAGQIINAIFSEARGLVDGLVPGLEQRFSPTVDANGAKWAKRNTLYLEPGTSVLTVLDSLSGKGLIEWRMNGRQLEIANPDSWSMKTGVEIVREEGSEVPMRSTLGGLLHTAFLLGDGGETWRVDNPGAPTPWGKTMKVLTQGGVKDEQTAKAMIQAELDAGSRERFEYTWQTQVDNLAWIPLIHVSAGDWVKFRGPGEVLDVRIFQVVLSVDGEVAKVAFTLNDRFEDSQVRQAKRIKGIVNGAHGDAGTGSLPGKKAPEGARPAPPEGLVAESEGYWNNSAALSRVRVGFTHSGLDTDGLAIDIAHFIVSIGGLTSRTSSMSNVVLTGFLPGSMLDIAIYAVSADGVISEPLTGQIKAVAPDVKPDAPTKLQLDSGYGIVTVIWDGMLQAQGQKSVLPPAYFSRIIIEESLDQHEWSTVGSLYDAGRLTLDRQAKIGKTYYYRAKSVTVNGIESDTYSPTASAKVVSKLSEKIDEERRQITEELKTAEVDISRLAASPGNTFKNGVISALAADRAFARELVSRKILVGTPENPVKSVGIADGAVTADKITMDKGFAKKFWADEGNFGKVTSKILASDAIDGKTITGSVIRTNEGDTRTELTPGNGLTVWKDGRRMVEVSSQYPTGLAVYDPVLGMRPLSGAAFGHLVFSRGGKSIEKRFFTERSLDNAEVAFRWNFSRNDGTVKRGRELGEPGRITVDNSVQGFTIMVNTTSSFYSQADQSGDLFEAGILVKAAMRSVTTGAITEFVECVTVCPSLRRGESSVQTGSATRWVRKPASFGWGVDQYKLQLAFFTRNGLFGHGAPAGTAELIGYSVTVLPQ
ncbi:hypothetical protein [Arcanobacterium haemolyticum]